MIKYPFNSNQQNITAKSFLNTQILHYYSDLNLFQPHEMTKRRFQVTLYNMHYPVTVTHVSYDTFLPVRQI